MLKKLIFSLTLFGLLFTPTVYAQGNSQQAIDLPPKGKDQAQTDSATDEINIQIESVDEQGEMQGNNKKLDFKVTDGTPPAKDGQDIDITPGRGQSQGKGMQAINDHASQVVNRVQQLLNDPELAGQGIGQQVREVARAQNKAQERIQEHVRAIEARGRVMKFFFGSDQQAVKGLEKQLQENKDRLAQMEELADQVPTEEAQTKIDQAKQALEDQNEALDQAVAAEKQVRGIFGRLISLFQ
jgi:hypothetical protein